MDMFVRVLLAVFTCAGLLLPVHTSDGAAVTDDAIAEQAADTASTDKPVDYGGTYKKALRAAQQGDEEAQFILGAMYYNGDVIEQDYAKAAYWFQKSVEDPWGFLDAGKIALGIMYHLGRGMQLDYVRACYLYEEAANIGDPFDVYNFEQMPISLLNDRPDIELALRWFQEAADNGDAGAQFCLAVA
jgi:hypothetical protein